MVGHGGSSAGSYLADPTSSIPSYCASIVATSTLRVKYCGVTEGKSLWRLNCTYIALLTTIKVTASLYETTLYSTLLYHSYCTTAQKKTVTTMLTYPWKCTVLHCKNLGNTWKPLVLMNRHFDYCLSVSEGDNQSVRSSAPVVSRCFPGGYNVKQYISRGRLAWLLLAFLHSDGK